MLGLTGMSFCTNNQKKRIHRGHIHTYNLVLQPALDIPLPSYHSLRQGLEKVLVVYHEALYLYEFELYASSMVWRWSWARAISCNPHLVESKSTATGILHAATPRPTVQASPHDVAIDRLTGRAWSHVHGEPHCCRGPRSGPCLG